MEKQTYLFRNDRHLSVTNYSVIIMMCLPWLFVNPRITRAMSVTNPPPALLTPADVARVLSVSVPMVKKLMRNGALDSLKVGRCRRVPVDAVQDLISRCRSSRV